MSCAQWVLLHVPSFLIVLIIAAVYITLSIIGLYVIRAFHSPAKLKLHNDVAGFIFATLGVTYAVLLSFIVIVTWQNFDEAHKNAAREANYIVSLYHDTRPLPPAFRSELKNNLVTYVDAIIEDEWPIMIKGEQSAQAQQAQDAIWKLYSRYLPTSETQRIFFMESVDKLNDACELRRARLLEAHLAIHPVIYFVLIVGGADHHRLHALLRNGELRPADHHDVTPCGNDRHCLVHGHHTRLPVYRRHQRQGGRFQRSPRNVTQLMMRGEFR